MSITSLIGVGVSYASGWFGGETWVERYRDGQNGGTVVCSGTPELGSIERAVRRMPDSDISWITQTLAKGNGGKAPASRDELANRSTMLLWVTALLGGGNCTYDKDPAEGATIKARFLSLVQNYGTDNGVLSFDSYSTLSEGFDAGESGFQTQGDFESRLEAALNAFVESGETPVTPAPATQAGFQGINSSTLLVVGAIAAAFLILRS